MPADVFLQLIEKVDSTIGSFSGYHFFSIIYQLPFSLAQVCRRRLCSLTKRSCLTDWTSSSSPSVSSEMGSRRQPDPPGHTWFIALPATSLLCTLGIYMYPFTICFMSRGHPFTFFMCTSVSLNPWRERSIGSSPRCVIIPLSLGCLALGCTSNIIRLLETDFSTSIHQRNIYRGLMGRPYSPSAKYIFWRPTAAAHVVLPSVRLHASRLLESALMNH